MCGIAGFVGPADGQRESVARRMTAALSHRGPDHQGIWSDSKAGIWLGHARLSILDLSPAGHQPMASANGRYVISYNGEIYNFKELAQELKELGHAFGGRSDTEVVLAAISQWGLLAATRKFNGMFAFGLWDRSERVLHLVRDRMGEKPLYYGLAKKGLFFASELKALRRHPDFSPVLDRDALALYLRYGCVPAPHSIYRGIMKLPPGCMLSFPKGTPRIPAPVPYWSLSAAANEGRGRPFQGTESEAADELERLLGESVGMRMEADVPLGAFLSGGIDSSVVVALMAARSARPIQTFTVGFEDASFDESGHAKRIAGHLGTAHTEIRLGPKETLAVIPRLPVLYDEPFADASQVPTVLVSQLARKSVKVSLSGDGGDELFGGYTRYLMGRAIWSKVKKLPLSVRQGIAKGLRLPDAAQWERLAPAMGPLLKRYGTQGTFGDKVLKVADTLSMRNPDDLYLRLVSNWDQPNEALAEGGGAFAEPRLQDAGAFPDVAERMMYWDMATYLPEDILVKLDRAAMGVGLESRVPLLDHRLVEFALRLPLGLKVRGGEGKWILRQVLKRHIPEGLFKRDKMGFGMPVADWLRGELRDWAESLLDPVQLKQEGFLKPEPIRARWTEHLAGKRNWQNQLWVVLMFQAWLRETRG